MVRTKPRKHRCWRQSAVGLLVVAVVLAASLTVGLGGANAAPRTHKATTITVAAQASATYIAFQALAKNFEKAYPDIRVNVVSYPVQTYAQVIQTQLRAGNAPDVFYGSSGTGNSNSLLPLGKAGYLADLSSLKFATRIPPSQKSYFYVGKKLYAMPLNMVFFGGLYNVGLFNQLGLKIPTTWSQLLSTCQAAKAKGKSLFSVSGLVAGTSIETIAASYVYGVDPTWNEKRAAGKVTFEGTPAWHTALQRWIDLNNKGCFEPGAAGVSLAQSVALVGSQQALGWLGVSSNVGSIKQIDPSLNIRVYAVPGASAKTTRVVAGFSDSMGVNAKSPNLADALKFIAFIAREGQSRIYPNVTGNVSMIDAKLGKLPQHLAPLLPYLKQNKTVGVFNLVWPNGEVYSAIANGATGLLTGQMSIDDVLKSMDAAYDKGATS